MIPRWAAIAVMLVCAGCAGRGPTTDSLPDFLAAEDAWHHGIHVPGLFQAVAQHGGTPRWSNMTGDPPSYLAEITRRHPAPTVEFLGVDGGARNVTLWAIAEDGSESQAVREDLRPAARDWGFSDSEIDTLEWTCKEDTCGLIGRYAGRPLATLLPPDLRFDSDTDGVGNRHASVGDVTYGFRFPDLELDLKTTECSVLLHVDVRDRANADAFHAFNADAFLPTHEHAVTCTRAALADLGLPAPADLSTGVRP